jgi:ketosteroid isomerase-like protein
MTSMTTPANAADLWVSLAGAVQRDDLETARTFVTDDFEWEVMGRFPYAGRYRGVEGLSKLFHGVRDASGDTFHLEPELNFGDDRAAVIVGRVTASRAGKTLDARNIFLVECADGLIVRGSTVPVDQYAYDEFWE